MRTELVAQMLDRVDGQRHGALAGPTHNAHELRTHRQGDAPARAELAVGVRKREPGKAVDESRPAIDRLDVADEEIHRWRPDETGDEQAPGIVVDVVGRADLLQPAIAHHADAIAHGHGLDLIVRDEDHRRVQALLEIDQLRTQRHPQGGIERGQRFVEQEARRVTDDRLGGGDALALAARELARHLVEQVGNVDGGGGLVDALVDFGLGQPAPLQAHVDVLPGGQMRIEQRRLEDHRDAALVGRLRRSRRGRQKRSNPMSAASVRQSCSSSWTCRSPRGRAGRGARHRQSPGPGHAPRAVRRRPFQD